MAAYVIFDLDNTLCDYSQAMAQAKTHVSKVLETHGIQSDDFWRCYHASEPSLYREFAQRNITKETYRYRRYADVLQEIGFAPLDLSHELNEVYMREANHKIQLFEDALPLLQRLKQEQIGVAIFTNGPADGQRDKIRALGLMEHVEKIYISEEIGVFKPHAEAYAHVLRDLGAEPSEVWMVGDSPDHDYKGALQAGLRSILLDREDRYGEVTSDRIRSLAELWEYVG